MILPLFKYRAWQLERRAQYGLSFVRWSKWFAWYPVYCASDDYTAWLETVERCRVMSPETWGEPVWEYRLPC